VTYAYDDGNRLETVTDWNNGQFGYNYDNANRLTGLTLPNGVESGYTYDAAGRLTLLTHANITETIASYDYALDQVGNRTALTETLTAAQNLPLGAYQESNGLVVMEAENFGERTDSLPHRWLLANHQSGYTGTAYLQLLPDLDATIRQTNTITSSPVVAYPINFTTPGTYTVWLRGYPANAGGDSVYVGLGTDGQGVDVTGFAPGQWMWMNRHYR
jgi:YD repeat-containing protein